VHAIARGDEILEMNGTKDEAIPPRTVDAHREVMEPHARWWDRPVHNLTRVTFQPWSVSFFSSSACDFHSSFGIGSHFSACWAKAVAVLAASNVAAKWRSVRFMTFLRSGGER